MKAVVMTLLDRLWLLPLPTRRRVGNTFLSSPWQFVIQGGPGLNT
jgi:hypothetical protein